MSNPPPPRRAPQARPERAASGSREELNALLSKKYGITNLADFLVVVEGSTDSAYLRKAAELVLKDSGEDLLKVPQSLSDKGTHMTICVPGIPGQPGSGGTDRMVELARDLYYPFFSRNALTGVVFLFDDDQAGRNAQNQIAGYGFAPGRHSLRIDRATHPAAAGDGNVVIEDLLPLQLQKKFFDIGGATCDFEYRRGALTRIRWLAPSKGDLRKHVVAHATVAELGEVVRVLKRIREMFGFPDVLPKDPR